MQKSPLNPFSCSSRAKAPAGIDFRTAQRVSNTKAITFLPSPSPINFKTLKMNIQFNSAEPAFCPRLKTREGHEEHISQPHLPISSLPGPAEVLEISHFPIAVHSKTAVFNPEKIANLWLQLLIIQVQNGNF
jgi:hypothetical protein